MVVIVSYDVETTTPAGRRRLRKVGQACVAFGQRVQFSVFECHVSRENWVRLRSRLLSLYDPDKDSLRFYFLGDDESRIEHHGTKSVDDISGLLLA